MLVKQGERRYSLASHFEYFSQDGAFGRAIAANAPEVDQSRLILQKQTGKRDLEDIHVLKLLLASSKLLNFFSNMDAYKLDKLYQSLEMEVYNQKGAYVFHEGDVGENFYLVFTGMVEIVQNKGNTNDPTVKPVHIAYLYPGDTFGERALLYKMDKRQATVMIASEKAELVLINRTIFNELLNNEASTDVDTKRFRSNKDIIRNIFLRNSEQRSEKDLKFVVEYLKGVKFFSRFSFEVRKKLCKVMKLITASVNTIIFEEGQIGRHFYIIFTGSVECSVKAKNLVNANEENVVSTFGEGEYFGELALSVEEVKRHGNVVCTEYSEFLVLSREQYEPLIKNYQNEFRQQYVQMLKRNPYFMVEEWNDDTIECICSVMTEKYFSFQSEICRQGSRATEMFIITRGECLMFHEGKHPITNETVRYELGRFGPNSVLGCAEASAGKFNDIFLHNFSIVAESPVRLLVLSRFDIFHLISPEARASLQRSANSCIHETIESRAVKTIAWNRYRKDSLEEIFAKKKNLKQKRGVPAKTSSSSPGSVSALPVDFSGIVSGSSPTLFTLKSPLRQSVIGTLSKSSSTPAMKIEHFTLQQLVDPGCIILERKARTRSNVNTDEANSPNTHSIVASSKIKEKQALIENEITQSKSSTPSSAHSETHSKVMQNQEHVTDPIPSNNSNSHLSGQTNILERRCHEEVVNHIEPMSNVMPRTPKNPDLLSLPLRPITPSLGGRKSKNILQFDTSHVLPKLNSPQEFHSHSGTHWHGSIDRRKSTKTNVSYQASNEASSSIWNPIHGISQPFCLVGFLKENLTEKMSPVTKKEANPIVIVKDVQVITAFRIFGKYIDIDDTLRMFREICELESTPFSDKDISRFAIYKENEITMVLENFFTSKEQAAAAFSSSNTPSRADESHSISVVKNENEVQANEPHEFRLIDLQAQNGQRFACISVFHENNSHVIESMLVSVYQCFPTAQSALRFAKQINATSLANATLLIVPLFEWIRLDMLEHFDAKSPELEQNLEKAMYSNSGKYYSTSKARKDAMKRSEGLLPK